MLEHLEQNVHRKDLVFRVLVVHGKVCQIRHDREPQALHDTQFNLLAARRRHLGLGIVPVGGLCLAFLCVGCYAILGRVVAHLLDVSLIKVRALLVDEMVE